MAGTKAWEELQHGEGQENIQAEAQARDGAIIWQLYILTQDQGEQPVDDGP